MRKKWMRNIICSLGIIATVSIGGIQSPQPAFAETESELVASSSEMGTIEDVVTDDMEAIYGLSLVDGTYPIEVLSSSAMFKVIDAQLTVKEGQMWADITLNGQGYLKLFMGTGMEAIEADEEEYISFELNEDGKQVYRVPVAALDSGIACTAWSKKKEKWYDRVLVFSAASLEQSAFKSSAFVTLEELALEDGTYQVEVTLEGGSGRATVTSPTTLTVEDGKASAHIEFSSPNYDYMTVDGEKYLPVNTEGNAAFDIPIDTFDWKVPVTADTIAMSTPHEIEYTLYFESDSIVKEEAVKEETANEDTSAEGTETKDAEKSEEEVSSAKTEGESWCGLSWESSMELHYAEQFSVDYYEDGYKRIQIAENPDMLIVPEGKEIPEEVEDSVVILQQPLSNIYLVATSAMDFFSALDALDSIRLSGTQEKNWYIEDAAKAMADGKILYAGKYNAPDYEMIVEQGCSLAIESTMIYHSPEVKEKLEAFGIPVLVEHSSYETHPMGRVEWIKLYGALLGKEEEAIASFDQQMEEVKSIEAEEKTGKTVAFFFISSNGYVNVRTSDDYVAEMIRLAGGDYIFEGLQNDTALSTKNLTMEEFYVTAKDADCIIYNSTIDGELHTMEEFLSKNALLSEFKAVKENNVWCTGKNLFQETNSLGNMIKDIHSVLLGTEESDLQFLYRIES